MRPTEAAWYLRLWWTRAVCTKGQLGPRVALTKRLRFPQVDLRQTNRSVLFPNYRTGATIPQDVGVKLSFDSGFEVTWGTANLWIDDGICGSAPETGTDNVKNWLPAMEEREVPIEVTLSKRIGRSLPTIAERSLAG